MSYASIENLYRPKAQTILLFKEGYATEKIHGSSSHISFKSDREPQLSFFSGGEKHETFVAIFDQPKLLEVFKAIGHSEITIFGEVYGGKCQGMSWLYGKQMRFIVFEVQIGETWLCVPDAEDVAKKLGLDFVPYVKIPMTMEAIDAQRDADSVIAVRNGIDLTKLPEDKTALREGIVIRPIVEMRTSNGARVMAKHKSDKFNPERKHTPKVDDPEALKVYTEAQSAAEEFVTEGRLSNILSHLKEEDIDISKMGNIIKIMTEDVLKEASGEVVESKDLRKAIGVKTVVLFKKYLRDKIPT